MNGKLEIGVELVGKTLGQLKVESRISVASNDRIDSGTHYLCRCLRCGEEKTFTRRQLRKNQYKTCGSDFCRFYRQPRTHRKCKKCGASLLLSAFVHRKTVCIDCCLIPIWHGNKRQYIRQLAERLGCSNPLCHWTAPPVARIIDFHHVDRSTKLFQISQHRFWPTHDLVAEIEKCITLCANCHRLVHSGIVDVTKIPTIKLTNTDRERLRNEKLIGEGRLDI